MAFQNLKTEAIKIWKTYDDTHGYASEKINRIKDLPNVADNFMYIFAMFDWANQQKILRSVTKATKKEIDKRYFVPIF